MLQLMVQDNKTYLVELTEPLFGGIVGIGLFLVLKGKWSHASLYILPPVALHFCHNAGVIILGDVPWWPAYFLLYVVAIIVFACECIYGYAKSESPAEEPIMPTNESLKFVRRV